MSKQPKPWKRSLELISRCRSSGKTLCCFNRQTEEEGTEVIYFLEPGGDPVGRKTVENALSHGLLIPSNDGLFGPETSQTWVPAP